ncbi:MAG: BamA/TamA family outer membrane protein [Chlorobiaceae bacterium]
MSRAKACTLIALLLLCAISVYGQSASADKDPSTTATFVGKISFSGNKATTNEELLHVIATSERKSFLGLGLFAGALKPFNQEEFQKDLTLIKKLYTYKGYFFADVDSAIDKKGNGQRVDLKIMIREHEPSKIDSLKYEGLEKISRELQASYLEKKRLKINDVFSVERLIDERNRTISFFKEEGYALFHEDSIRIKVDTVGHRAGVLFKLNLPAQLKYGQVYAVVHNPMKSDTSPIEKNFTQDKISGKVIGKQKISTDLITSAIEFRPGKVTRQSLEQRTLQNFGRTNIFSSIYITPDSIRADKLFTTVHLETAPRHQIEPKLLADNRYGSLYFAGSLAYEDRNLLGGAEQFLLSAEFGSQLGDNNRLLTNLDPSQYTKVVPNEFNLKSSLIMPVLKKPGNFYSVTAEYTSSTQPVLLSSQIGLIRGTYNAKLTPSSNLAFDFFEIALVKSDSLRGFKQLFTKNLAQNIGIDPSNNAAVNAGIDSLLQTHIDQTFRLRYNFTNRKSVPAEKTIWNLDLLLEDCGTIPWLIDKYLDTRTYYGFTGSDPQIFGTFYTQYIKLEPALSITENLSPQSQIAGRGKIGWMTPWGKAASTPEERRFYAGGANSMRGWLFNNLGPANSSNNVVSNFGADVKLELNLEYRLKFFKLFNQSSGLTFFTDAGNIWDRTGQYAFSLASMINNYAWDAGIGLRVGSPIGPFRFDFAYKLRDPTQSEAWRISTWKLSDFTFNFGIGEAF